MPGAEHSGKHASLIALFESSVQRFAGNVLLWEKKGDAYCGMTYAETRDLVELFAAGLLSLGLKAGDRVALLAEGRNDWVISELGILFAGAVNVPLSVKLQGGSELGFRLEHSECRMAVASAAQMPKLRQLRNELPLLETIIMLDRLDSCDKGELQLEDLYAAGRAYLQGQRPEFDARREAVRGADPATICYTSGTTAEPKGVVLTHRNYAANVEQSSAMFDIPEWYTSLLILPWDHCFAHTAGIYTLMRNGASMASVQIGKSPPETLKNIPLNIRESRPSFLLSVPALARNFKKSIEAGVRAKGRVAAALFRAGLRVAFFYNGNGWDRGIGVLCKPLVALFDLILFRKIRENFGGRLEFFVGGGALLDIELQKFFGAIGIPMLQGYGLTESAPVISANTMARHKFGSSGLIVPDLTVRICDEQGIALPAGVQGEIVVKGENVMAGYWRNERATAEVLREGWLYTGDLGYVDSDGFLFVVGRTKSLLIANDGEKYSPEGIEETVSGHSEYIDQLMLYNDQSPFTVGLLVPRRDAVMAWMKAHGHSPDTAEGQCAALRLLSSEIDAFRSGGRHGGLFPERWLPSSLAVLADGFTEQNGLMNSTLKMVRGRIVECHANRIREAFGADGKNVCNAQNRKAIRAMAEPAGTVVR